MGHGAVGTLQPPMLWGTATGRSTDRALYTGLSSKFRDLLTIFSKGMMGSDTFQKCHAKCRVNGVFTYTKNKPGREITKPRDGKMEKRE